MVWRLVLKARKKIWSFASFPVKLSTKKNREEGGLEQVRREGSGSRDASNLQVGSEGRGRRTIVSEKREERMSEIASKKKEVGMIAV